MESLSLSINRKTGAIAGNPQAHVGITRDYMIKKVLMKTESFIHTVLHSQFVYAHITQNGALGVCSRFRLSKMLNQDPQ